MQTLEYGCFELDVFESFLIVDDAVVRNKASYGSFGIVLILHIWKSVLY